MNKFHGLYTASLVTANMATAGVMYLLSSPLFATMLVALGLIVLMGSALTEQPTLDSEAESGKPSLRV